MPTTIYVTRIGMFAQLVQQWEGPGDEDDPVGSKDFALRDKSAYTYNRPGLRTTYHQFYFLDEASILKEHGGRNGLRILQPDEIERKWEVV